MTGPWPPAGAFRASVTSRLRARAAQSGRSVQELGREFLMLQFLGRVFAEPDAPWVLQGGSALLLRLPGARSTRDLDLVATTGTLEQAVERLAAAGRPGVRDPYEFLINLDRDMKAAEGAGLKVDVVIDRDLVGRFPIDVALGGHMVGRVERLAPSPVIHVPGLAPPPVVTLIPLADQVADKVSAMYEMHGTGRASTRFRDLVDLVLITGRFPLDAAESSTALAGQARRRNLTLPGQLVSPGPQWERGYARIAAATILPGQLCALDAALARAGTCLDPVLSGRVTAGTWDPDRALWSPPAPTPGAARYRLRDAFPAPPSKPGPPRAGPGGSDGPAAAPARVRDDRGGGPGGPSR